MVRTASPHDKPAGPGTVVRAPRPTDAVAGALRRAYGAAGDLPPEIARAMGLLGRIPG